MRAIPIRDAFKNCAITSVFVDLPIRSFVVRKADLPNTYVWTSFVVEFTTCLGKALIPACDDNLICDLGQGAITYAARASTIGQDVIARAVLGAANKLAYAYLKFVGAPVVVESGEPVIVTLTKNMMGYEEEFIPNIALGANVGLLCVFYGNVASYVSEIMEGDQTIRINATEYHNESLSAVDHDGQPLGSQEMCLLGEG